MTDALASADGPPVTQQETSWWSSTLSSVGQAVGNWMGQVSQALSTSDGENMTVTQDEVDAARNVVNGVGEGLAAIGNGLNQTYQTTDGENMVVTQEELDACKSSGCSFGVSADFTFVAPMSGGGGSWGANLQYTPDNGVQFFTYSSEANPSAGFQVGAGIQANFAWGHGDWSGPFDNVSGSADIVTLGGFRSSDFSQSSGYQGITFGVGPGLPGGSATTTNYTCRIGC
jgi:hypothetical protein